MGKKQHHKDKLWVSQGEWSTIYGGKAASSRRDPGATERSFRRLPYNYCTISLQPFSVPLCAPDGYIFDILSIVPFLKTYGVHPVTGAPLEAQQLVKLKFHKNANGEFHCPVLFKALNESSHIVAIKTTGNVYSYEAVDTLNLKTQNFRDLLTDKPFTRQDIITLQDPLRLEKHSPSNFYHLKNKLQVTLNKHNTSAESSSSNLGAAIAPEARHALAQLKTTYKPPTDPTLYRTTSTPYNVYPDVATDDVNKANYSTGKVAASFTSTTLQPETRHEFARIDEDSLRYAKVIAQKKKAYGRLVTNLGPLNFELYADQCPRTCDNFLRHCRSNYYNNTIFHRLIRNFIVQGGDPTATGAGGESAFEGGRPFEDEIRQHLKHEGRGMLSMANSGLNTNKSQFFITFRSAPHLNGKHTVFGKLVGGFETLDKMEYVAVNKLDRPEQDVKLLSTNVFGDPYADADEQLRTAREKLTAVTSGNEKTSSAPISALFQGDADDDDTEATGFGASSSSSGGGVGKYLKRAVAATTAVPVKRPASSLEMAAPPTSVNSVPFTTVPRETLLKRTKLASTDGGVGGTGGRNADMFSNFSRW